MFVRQSKTLAWILRHGAKELHLDIDENGWVSTEAVLAELSHRHKTSMAILETIVATDSKGRYEFSPDKTMIRACQGHSADLGLRLDDLTKITADNMASFPFVVHGTNPKAYDAIRASGGLSRMSRQHIHFATAMTEAEAMDRTRVTASVFLFLDVAKCLADGIELFVSTNNVVLSPGVDGIIPLTYINHVL